jgi:hypothetical protein
MVGGGVLGEAIGIVHIITIMDGVTIGVVFHVFIAM